MPGNEQEIMAARELQRRKALLAWLMQTVNGGRPIPPGITPSGPGTFPIHAGQPGAGGPHGAPGSWPTPVNPGPVKGWRPPGFPWFFEGRPPGFPGWQPPTSVGGRGFPGMPIQPIGGYPGPNTGQHTGPNTGQQLDPMLAAILGRR